MGFLGVHNGRGADVVYIDWWAEENELHHHVYVAPHSQLDQFEYVTSTGLIACVWDLRVLCFECQAWLQSVLANPNAADLDHYVRHRLNAAHLK